MARRTKPQYEEGRWWVVSDRLYRAIKFAERAHAGQIDKQGRPYIEHVKRVMRGGETESERVLGVLHDVLEDTPNSLADVVSAIPLDEREASALVAISRVKERESYEQYIERVAANPLASAVKVIDLTDNMSRGRAFPSLMRRYRRALHRLAPSDRTSQEKNGNE